MIQKVLREELTQAEQHCVFVSFFVTLVSTVSVPTIVYVEHQGQFICHAEMIIIENTKLGICKCEKKSMFTHLKVDPF